MSNSDEEGEGYPQEDIAVRIRLYLPDVDAYGAMKLTLQIPGETRQYISDEGEYLSQFSSVAMEKGEGGWIYTFQDHSGEELLRVLEGGKVSDLNLTLIASEVSMEIKDYQLLVDIIQNNGPSVIGQRKGG